MLEEALCYELSKIPEFKGEIYPTNIPKGTQPPFLIYILSNFNQERCLDGYLPDEDKSFLLNVMAKEYEEMKNLTQTVKEMVQGWVNTSIGEVPIYVEDVEIINMTDTYENEIELYRGILDIKIYY